MAQRWKTLIVSLYLCCVALAETYPPSHRTLSSRQTGLLCNESAEWSLTYDAYTQANTTYYLGQLRTEAYKRGQRFDDALGKLLGYNNFRCGIGLGASCSVGSCFGQPRQVFD